VHISGRAWWIQLKFGIGGFPPPRKLAQKIFLVSAQGVSSYRCVKTAFSLLLQNTHLSVPRPSFLFFLGPHDTLQCVLIYSITEYFVYCFAHIYLLSMVSQKCSNYVLHMGSGDRGGRRGLYHIIPLTNALQAYQSSRICRESHDFSCNLKVSQAAISISRFLAELLILTD